MTVNYSRASDFVSSHQAEAVKTYSVYDGSNRLTDFYVALSDARNGESCMRTQYEYDGASARVLKSKETLSTWNSTWDI